MGTKAPAKKKGLPKAFIEFLKEMSEHRRESFMTALKKSDVKSKRLFAAVLKKIISMSQKNSKIMYAHTEKMSDTMEKIEENMEEKFDLFKKEEKAKMTDKVSKARKTIQSLRDSQASLQKQLRDTATD